MVNVNAVVVPSLAFSSELPPAYREEFAKKLYQELLKMGNVPPRKFWPKLWYWTRRRLGLLPRLRILRVMGFLRRSVDFAARLELIMRAANTKTRLLPKWSEENLLAAMMDYTPKLPVKPYWCDEVRQFERYTQTVLGFGHDGGHFVIRLDDREDLEKIKKFATADGRVYGNWHTNWH